MNALVNQNKQDVLRHFIPLNTLPKSRFDAICNEIEVEEWVKGTVLFDQGDETKEFIYLISGMISLYAGEMEMETIVTGSEAARFAVAHHIPRKVKAVTKSKVRIVRIPTYKLDMNNSADQTQTYLVDDVDDQAGDWMTTMLQSPVFQRLPAANLQKIMMQMEEVAFEAGQTVVQQGDEADFYYIIKSGDCELIRQASATARPVKLAELHSCEAFGEDALLSGNPRNVTVRMKGNGQMLRLSKKNFITLVKEPVLKYVNYEEGLQQVNGGANWLDVRSTDAYEDQHIEDSVNIPFFSLRMKIAELKHDQLQVLVCENGRTSEAAAFLLLKFGFNALILKEGMEGMQAVDAVDEAEEKGTGSIPMVEPDDERLIAEQAHNASNAQELHEASNKIEELERFCAQLNEKLHTVELDRNQWQQQHQKITQELTQAQALADDTETQLKAFEKDAITNKGDLDQTLSHEQANNQALQAELDSHQTEIEQLRLELDSLRQSQLEEQQGHDGLAVELAKKDDEIAMQSSEMERLQNALTELQDKNNKSSAAQQQLEQAEQQLSELTNQRDEVEQRNTQLESEANQLQQEKAELEQQLEQLISESSGTQAEKDQQVLALSEQLDEVNVEKEVLEQSKRELDGLLQTALKEMEQVKTEGLQALQLQTNEADIKVTTLQTELSTLAEQLSEKTTEFETQGEQLGELSEWLSLRDQTIAENQAEIQSLNDQMKAASNGLDETQEQCAELEKNVLEKEELLERSIKHAEELDAERDALIEAKQQVDIALDGSRSELERIQLNAEIIQQELDAAQKLTEVAESSLEDLTLTKAALEEELALRIAELENQLMAAEQDKAEQDKLIVSSRAETEQAKEQQLSLESELSSRVQELQIVNDQLVEINTSSELKEGERLELLESVEQLKTENEAAQAALIERDQAIKDSEVAIGQREEVLASEIKQWQDQAGEAEQKLQQALQEKTAAEQQLTALQDEVSSGLDGHQQLTEQLAQLRQQRESDVATLETERAALSDSLQQAQQSIKATELAFKEAEQASQQTQEGLNERLAVLQLELEESLKQTACSTEELAVSLKENKQLEQKLEDTQGLVSNSSEDQQALLQQLEEARSQVTESTQSRDALQLEVNEFAAIKLELEQKTLSLKDSLEATQSELKDEKKRQLDATAKLENLAANTESSDQQLQQQVSQLEDDLQVAGLDKAALSKQLQALESQLASVSETAGQFEVELDELKQTRVVDAETSNETNNKVAELTLSLKQLEEEKKQLLEAQNADEADNVKQLETQLGEVKQQKEDLQQRINELEKTVSQLSEAGGAGQRIKELEKELDEASSYLMDLEIKLETAKVGDGDDDELTEEETSELEAIKSELNLVREQTEKDVQAMKLKLANSEKMNLALNKKILSMQTIANQDVTPEEEPTTKKKGWWK
ncbi:MAG: cyclic nucleotide-binding domain-containing protein [Cycloclasticus sp.]|nr:cyclic nucleotide-binding domain-containing protein [Cycloclasticus sp.]MBQ0790719.1 cyclic nucleotide-binding domain-containing protein [Cycloclasticus sp.]